MSVLKMHIMYDFVLYFEFVKREKSATVCPRICFVVEGKLTVNSALHARLNILKA